MKVISLFALFLLTGQAIAADAPLVEHVRAANDRFKAVMYEPMPDGTMALVAVEYIAFKGPAALEGQLFNILTEPNRYGLDTFYELHVWAWRPNPAGNFADNNMNVSCAAAKPAN
jgi:hypothetical protein